MGSVTILPGPSYSEFHLIRPATGDFSRLNVKQMRRSASLSQAISAKLENRYIKAAVRLLMSADSPAEPSQKSLHALCDKHSPASSDLTDLPIPQSVNELEAREAILSFPAGSSGGPNGLRPQHFRNTLLRQESGAEFLSAMTDFVNTVIAGCYPTEVAPVFLWSPVGSKYENRGHSSYSN